MDARIDALPGDDKAVLQAAAAIGRAVWPGAVASLTGRPEPWVLPRLDALAADQFLQRAGSEYRFEHGLLRERAFASIPRARLVRLHLGVADWLESLSPDRAGERAEMLAHHLWEAHGYAAEHDGASPELTARVGRALRAAGDRAAALQAFGVARGYFAKARDLWPDDEPGRAELLLRLGKAAYQAGELEEATATLPPASAALEAAGQPGLAGEAEACLTYIAHGNGRHAEMRRHMDRAMTLVDGLGRSASKAEVLVDLAIMLSLERDHERTLAAGREALAIARELGLREVEASALSAIGVSRGLAGDLGGRDDLRRSVEITEELGSHLSAHCLGMLADLEGQLGDLRSCFALQERARAHAERFGHAAHVEWFAAESIGRDYWTGDWEAALRTADEFIARADAGSPTFMTGYCRIMRGRIRLARDDVPGALDDAARAVAFAGDAEDLQMLYPALAFRARACTVADAAEAVGAADAVLALWRSHPDAYPVSAWGADLLYALEAQGRAAAIGEIAASASVPTRWLEALVAYAGGDFAAAAEAFARVGSRPDEERARLRAGSTGSRHFARDRARV
jgi:tetratricopeptide (TPR) repeat protein